MSKRKIISFLVVFLFLLFPVFNVWAVDGSGTATVSTSPTHIAVNSTGNELIFTFTAAETMNSGAISITMPSGWSAPQGSSGTAGYTTSTSSGTLGKVENNLDSITSPLWQSSASTTVASETTRKKEGAASLKLTFDVTALAGEIAYATTSAQDWSNYTKIGIWVYSSTTQAGNGDLQFGIATTTDFSGAAFVDIAPTTADTWVYHVLDISGISSAIRSSVQSYGIKYAVDYFGASEGYVYLDEMLIGPDNVNALSFSSQTVTARILELGNGDTITINYGAGGGSSGATAPSTAQSYTFTTKSKIAVDGTLTEISTSPSVLVHPAAITDLVAQTGERAGVIDLSWTIPAGSPTGYVVKYSTSAIDSDSAWSAATTFSQSWPGTTSSGYVTGLSPGTLYYFAIKATGLDSTLAALSNSPSARAGQKGIVDEIAPSTTIERPKAQEEIESGKDYIIKGVSQDTGGSSVKEVLLSLDGGVTWQRVTPLQATDSGFSWEYIWESPELGDYTILARATDWLGNSESPGAEVTVKVVEKVLPEEVGEEEEEEEEEEIVEKPVKEMTVEEIKAKILEIQQKIIELLKQLIELLQSQIAELET